MEISVSTGEWEVRVGMQIRRARLDADLDQRTLAASANVSVGALRNLESGQGANLRTCIRVVRALGQTAWLEQLYPTSDLDPVALARARQLAPKRQRATRRAR